MMDDIKCGEIDIMNEHVYCTDCINWPELLEAIEGSKFQLPIPKDCENCFPYDPEDSRPFWERKNYKAECNFRKINISL